MESKSEVQIIHYVLPVVLIMRIAGHEVEPVQAEIEAGIDIEIDKIADLEIGGNGQAVLHLIPPGQGGVEPGRHRPAEGIDGGKGGFAGLRVYISYRRQRPAALLGDRDGIVADQAA